MKIVETINFSCFDIMKWLTLVIKNKQGNYLDCQLW